MDSNPKLAVSETRNAIRHAGINPNHWYPVGWSEAFRPAKPVPVTVWNQTIAVFRASDGSLHALEDACLHKGVALHKGTVAGDRIVCAYHGWEFDGLGRCVRIPYLPEGRKCPSARVRAFPVREGHGIVWLFPGDPALADGADLPAVPEYGDPNWLMIRIPGHFRAHFSICNENTMDVFHGHLHKDLQGWFDPILTKLDREEGRVVAEYQVTYRSRLAKLLGLAKSSTETCQRTVSIDYTYPHYRNHMERISALYLMRLPVGPAETRSFSLMFLKPGLPGWLWRPLRRPLSVLLWRLLLKRFLDQDKGMMESEQATFADDPGAVRVEINPAIVALRRVTVAQDHCSVTTDNLLAPQAAS